VKKVTEKVIKKDEKVIAISKKRKRTNEDVIFLLTHDPVLKIFLFLPLIGLGFNILFNTIDMFSVILWLGVYVIVFVVLKYAPPANDQGDIDYEKRMPKRKTYQTDSSFLGWLSSWILYAIACIQFIIKEIKSETKEEDKK